MRRPASLALLTLLLLTTASQAVITKLTPLAEVLESEQFIFVAGVDKTDPEKPSAVFKFEKNLKGEAPFERIAVNMTGDDEAKKENDTKTILDRLDATRKVVFFVSKRGKKYNAMAFVEGSWFSVQGTIDDADKTVRWAFLHGEPFLRRTFKGTSAELVKVIEDGLAKKAKPPEPNEKEPKGYGPAVEKKKCEESGDRGQETGGNASSVSSLSPVPCPLSPTLFAVIPSFVLVGPLAVVAALFPGLFARMAVGMKRWRAFLVVASINSTLALVYFFTQRYLPGGWWFGPQAFTIYLLAITTVGLSWAGRRYRRMAADEPQVTNLPSKIELYSLAGLTLFAVICVLLTAIFASWGANLELPIREFTFIGIALAAATAYAGYRVLTAKVDLAGATAPDRRLSLSGETVGLGVLFLCGLVAVLNGGARSAGPTATGTETGDADTIGPRFVGVKVFEVKEASQVMSGVTVVGDRLYFGTQLTRISGPVGNLFCLDRETGEVKWMFGDDDGMLPVFCTPTVIDGRVYCGEGLHEDKNCRMFCVDAATGKPAWENPFKTKSHTEGGPAVLGNKVFFPAGDDGLYAADAKTGAQLWQFPGGKDKGIHIDAAPAVSGNRVFVGSGLYSYVAVCLDADKGTELWRADLKLRAFGEPVVVGRHVYYGVGTGNMGADVYEYKEEDGKKEDKPAGAVVCLEVETGKEVWRHDLPRSVHTGLAGDAFSVYAASRDGYVYAIDRKSGKLRWKTGIGGAVTSAPAVATAGGMPVAVYAVSREGTAVCLNPHTGVVVWQKRLPGFHWDGQEGNGVLSGPAVVTTPTATGSKRTIYIGAMTVDPNNTAKKTAAVFKFEDEIGGE
jgi:outer membrane protein assembly factor BamB